MGFERGRAEGSFPDVSIGRKCFILAAAVLCNSFVEGMCQSFTELYPILLEEFKNSGSAKIVLVGSLLPGIYLVTTPIYCLLLGRFDFLVVMVIGSVISSLGFIGSSFVTDGNQLILCYTLLAGVGFGGIHLCCIVIITRSFNSYRGTALAFVLAVSALSGFVVSPCTRSLISSYGWRGANQIYGALLLNGIACGMIFNEVGQPRKTNLGALKSKLRRLLRRIKLKEEIKSSYIMRQMVREREKIRESSTGSLDGCVITTDNSLVSASQAICAQQYFPESSLWRSNEGDDAYLYLVGCGDASRNINYKVTSGDILHSIPSSGKTSELRKLLEIFQKTSFILYTISFVVSFIASFLVVMNLPKHAFFVGLNVGQSRLLLNVLWVSNAGFRIPFGWACDKHKLFKFVLYPAVLVICGILSIALPWISSKEFLLFVSASLGIFMACLVTLNPVFLLDMFGTRQFSRSYSISSVFLGLSTMTAPLLPRWIPKSHSNSFITAGATIMAAGLTSLPLRWIHGGPKPNPIGNLPESRPKS